MHSPRRTDQDLPGLFAIHVFQAYRGKGEQGWMEGFDRKEGELTRLYRDDLFVAIPVCDTQLVVAFVETKEGVLPDTERELPEPYGIAVADIARILKDLDLYPPRCEYGTAGPYEIDPSGVHGRMGQPIELGGGCTGSKGKENSREKLAHMGKLRHIPMKVNRMWRRNGNGLTYR